MCCKNNEWREDRQGMPIRGVHQYNAMYMASSEIETALEVPRLTMIAKVLQEIRVHGDLIAAMMADKQN